MLFGAIGIGLWMIIAESWWSRRLR